MRSTITKLFLIMALGYSVTACNTISGLGQDVQAGGEAVEGAAEEAKP
jgi:entericidin B